VIGSLSTNSNSKKAGFESESEETKLGRALDINQVVLIELELLKETIDNKEKIQEMEYKILESSNLLSEALCSLVNQDP